MKFTLDEIMEEMWRLSSHLAWQMRLDQQKALEGLGLSPMQAFALMCVASGMDQPSALAFVMDASPQGVSQLLAGLEERKLVRRELDPEDRRKVRILLTQSGERLLEVMRENWKQVSCERFSRLSPEELEMLLRSYRKLIEPREKGTAQP
ncbi:MAG: MarR family transcriptional regulator [Meiothermus sp.]|uniref:MarR family winged helix-turn-helix transcriptional regulator n=1 Tax=Meiothermus sp. TaxID=1955249 RepID=UPI0025E7FC9F|nr:MarR family transcriptional regulator [Meiothermus sp.]MCS7059158.1 MarR family transcriptional regulator [Meiothermus sp.]MCS7194866.1 MarR family transcriptional regulator [Meiothermus sp.]MCX7741219.1 MarR family transcriptional regulator [Meiothermus sp.]MDW8090398.1 MarR family transcriptional regulator [Meiothermus sp.]MDW8481100.1 MarR family transcriptional regulator [Meiothermus sp.]